VDDTIDVKGQQCKVVDIKRDGVLISDLATEKQHIVTKLTDSERDLFFGVHTGEPEGGLTGYEQEDPMEMYRRMGLDPRMPPRIPPGMRPSTGPSPRRGVPRAAPR
jgi:hypothetical protein